MSLPEEMNLDIYYEDPDVIVVNKPKGMVVHPACWSCNRDACQWINGSL